MTPAPALVPNLSNLAAGVTVVAAVAVVLLPATTTWCASRRLHALRACARPAPISDHEFRTGPSVASLLIPATVLGTAGILLGWPLALLAATILAAGGWVRHRLRHAARNRIQQHRIRTDLPIAVDLLVSAIRAGSHHAGALATVGTAIGGPLGASLERAARQLHLGARADEVWGRSGDPPELAALGRVLTRTGATGASPADALAAFAEECRDRLRAQYTARAQRVSVLVVLPLGLCFLPAFLLLGVLPFVVGLADQLSLP
ncbi:type II secretion system F family protein [Lipingzhangella sp. LS1_29]|uniref:Type II secretion system F family protein n=1 Tax=Lipingzhangella rawalii TaxID=2055835 RepID=A0ABU2H5C9_9ACTN|nr:type II secretion system F family protein [Lipingzhangella rawalii]MDS1270020.1 type II secretion system F family protein [Lipingzhangella rawalii]